MGSRAHDLAAANNQPIQKIKQQQQQSLRADLAYASGAGSDAASGKFTLQDAFQHADIQPPTTRYIAREWRERTGRAITPEDVLAWHFYRLDQNQRKRRGAEPLEPGYIITRMRQGERATPAFYDQARAFLDEHASMAPPKSAEEDAHRALKQALAAFLPSLVQVGREGLEKAQVQLPLAAQGLAKAGVTARDIADFHLYLRLKDQPVPLPNDVARDFVALQDDFLAWKGRRQQAQEHWRSIAQELSLSAPVSIQRMLDEVKPVDLKNGALVLVATPGRAHHLSRFWKQRAQTIRTKLQLGVDFQLQFIPLKKDSR